MDLDQVQFKCESNNQWMVLLKSMVNLVAKPLPARLGIQLILRWLIVLFFDGSLFDIF